MEKAKETHKIQGEMLSERELRILRSGGSPWPDTKVPKRPLQNALLEGKRNTISSQCVAV